MQLGFVRWWLFAKLEGFLLGLGKGMEDNLRLLSVLDLLLSLNTGLVRVDVARDRDLATSVLDHILRIPQADGRVTHLGHPRTDRHRVRVQLHIRVPHRPPRVIPAAR